MNYINNTNSIYIKAINVTFSIIPLSYVIGSFVLNFNIALLIVLGIFFQKRELFKFNLNKVDKLIIVFFFFIIITALINTFENLSKYKVNDFTVLYKTFFYLRYLLLYFVLRFFIQKNIINFKWFFISSSALCLFVSLDIFFQFFNEKDIFGFVSPHPRKLPGPFGNELIAGGYLQRFSLLIFFIFPVFFQLKNKFFRNVMVITAFTIVLAAIVLSGNRMPLFLFILVVSLIIILEKKTRIFFPLFILSTSILLFILYNSNITIKNNLKSFYSKTSQLSKALVSEKIDRSKMPGHFHEFETFYDTWLMNKYIGGGLRSFRLNCPKRPNVEKEKDERTTCNNHPHNYYLEILTDLGVVGLLILSIIFFAIFYSSFIKKYFFSSELKENHLITPFVFIFIAEIFPIKSSGSFFTTGNSTIIFIVMAIIVGLIEKKAKYD